MHFVTHRRGIGTKMKQDEMKIQVKPLSFLKPAEYNPRKDLQPGDPEWEKIENSIRAFGYIQPILINADGTIISGHQRFKIMQHLGYEEVQCVIVDVDKETEKAMNVAMNKIDGDWDKQKLLDVLLDLDLNNIDLSLTGFERSELELLQEEMDEINIGSEAVDDDYDAETEYESISEPMTRRGDIWVIGEHRLMCGDSTDEGDVEELMNGSKADLLITDPPYNVNYGDKAEYLDGYLNKGHRNQQHIKNDNMDDASFYAFLRAAFEAAEGAMREGAGAYVFHSENEGINFRMAFADAGLKQSQCLIWEKNSFVLGRQDYHWRHEPILYGWKEGAAHYFIDDRTQDTVIVEDEVVLEDLTKKELLRIIYEFKRQNENKTSVIFENKPMRNAEHPTMKPISLIGKLMHNSSKPRWKVLDLFGGSGSTLMAAEQLSRMAYLMELDEKFCDVIVNRWVEYTGREDDVYRISPDGKKQAFNEIRR